MQERKSEKGRYKSKWHTIDWAAVLHSAALSPAAYHYSAKDSDSHNAAICEKGKERQREIKVTEYRTANMLFLRSGLIRKDLLGVFSRIKSSRCVNNKNLCLPRNSMGLNGSITSFEELEEEVIEQLQEKVKLQRECDYKPKQQRQWHMLLQRKSSVKQQALVPGQKENIEKEDGKEIECEMEEGQVMGWEKEKEKERFVYYFVLKYSDSSNAHGIHFFSVIVNVNNLSKSISKEKTSSPITLEEMTVLFGGEDFEERQILQTMFQPEICDIIKKDKDENNSRVGQESLLPPDPADEKKDRINKNCSPRKRVYQEYVVPNQLLGKGHKFHLRVLVLVVGNLHVYYYHEDIRVLFAPLPLTWPPTKESLKNPLEQITNAGVHQEYFRQQAKDPDQYNKNLSELLCEIEIREKERIQLVENLHCQLDLILKNLFSNLSKRKRVFLPLPNTYELFGFDFMYNQEGQLILLEVNPQPSLSMFSFQKKYEQKQQQIQHKKEIKTSKRNLCPVNLNEEYSDRNGDRDKNGHNDEILEEDWSKIYLYGSVNSSPFHHINEELFTKVYDSSKSNSNNNSNSSRTTH